MTTEKIKRMLDACYQAKRIRELLPPLPQGVTPSYIQYLDNIHALEKQGIQVKISDISDVMNLPRPGVTRTVKEMETKGYLRKISSPDDGRVYPLQKREENCHRNIMSTILENWFPISVRYPKRKQIA